MDIFHQSSAEMFPISTENEEVNDSRRLSAARRSIGGSSRSITEQQNALIDTELEALEDPPERVSVNQRRLYQQDSNDTLGGSSHHKALHQEDGYRIPPLHEGSRKKLQASLSGGGRRLSVDEATDDLVNMQRHQQQQYYHTKQHQNRRRSHDIQKSLGLEVASGHSSSSSSSATTRASLPDFKNMLRQMLPSKGSGIIRRRSSRKAASERGPRTVGLTTFMDQPIEAKSSAGSSFSRRSSNAGSERRSRTMDLSTIFDEPQDPNTTQQPARKGNSERATRTTGMSTITSSLDQRTYISPAQSRLAQVKSERGPRTAGLSPSSADQITSTSVGRRPSSRSERGPRTMGLSASDQVRLAPVTVGASHAATARRAVGGRPSSARGSRSLDFDMDILHLLEDKPRNAGSAHKRRLGIGVDSVIHEAVSSVVPSHHSPGVTKMWHKKRPSAATVAIRPHSSHTATTLDTSETRSIENHVSPIKPSASLDSAMIDRHSGHGSTLISAYTSRIERKSKRTELVEELSSSRESSMRVRDASTTFAVHSSSGNDNDNARHIRQSLQSITYDPAPPPQQTFKDNADTSIQGDVETPASPKANSNRIKSRNAPSSSKRPSIGTGSSPGYGGHSTDGMEDIKSPKKHRSKRHSNEGHSSWPKSAGGERGERKSSGSSRRSSSVSKVVQDSEKISGRLKTKKVTSGELHGSKELALDSPRKNRRSSSAGVETAHKERRALSRRSGEGRDNGDKDVDTSKKSRRSSSAGAQTARRERRESRRLPEGVDTVKKTRRSSSAGAQKARQERREARRMSASDPQMNRSSKTREKKISASGSSGSHRRRSSAASNSKSSPLLSSRSRGSKDDITNPAKKTITRRSYKTREGSYNALRDSPKDHHTKSDQSIPTPENQLSKIGRHMHSEPPSNKKGGFDDASELSFTASELARKDNSSKSLNDSRRDPKDNRKSKKKAHRKDRLSSSARLHESYTPSKSRKTKDSAGLESPAQQKWQSDSALMVDLYEIDGSHTVTEQLEDSLRKSRTAGSANPSEKVDKLHRSLREGGSGCASSSRKKDRVSKTTQGGEYKKSLRRQKAKEKVLNVAQKQHGLEIAEKPQGMVADSMLDWEDSAVESTEIDQDSTALSNTDTSVSIVEYLSRDSKDKNRTSTQSSSDPNHESRSSLPTLDDMLSADLSVGSDSDEGSTGGARESTSDRKDAVRLSRTEPGISDLGAIGDDPKAGEDAPQARVSLDLLEAVEIFRDSPTDSPLSTSLPQVWNGNSDVAVVERLVSSMPHLSADHGPSALKSIDDYVTSDDSPEFPELEPLDETEVDSMDEHHNPRSALSLSSKKHASLPMTSPSSQRPVATKGARRDFTSPRKADVDGEKGNLDRGPRKPQRRTDSFGKAGSPSSSDHEEDNMAEGNDHFEASLHWDIDMNADGGADSNSNRSSRSSVSLAFSSTSMEFQRDDVNGWVQKPPTEDVDLMDFGISSSVVTGMSSSAQELRYHHYNNSDNEDDDDDEMEPGWIRRSASLSDLDYGEGRWSTSLSSVDDAPPNMSRMSHHPTSGSSMNERLSTSMSGDQLGNMFASHKGEEMKDVERTYLPVSLQSAARRYDRSGRRPLGRADSDPSARRPIGGAALFNRGDNQTSTSPKMAVVETGLAEMFEMIGKLESDIIKFEHQTSHLRVQRSQLLSLELEDDDEEEEDEEEIDDALEA